MGAWSDRSIDRLIDWLVDWLVGWLVDLLIDWFVSQHFKSLRMPAIDFITSSSQFVKKLNTEYEKKQKYAFLKNLNKIWSLQIERASEVFFSLIKRDSYWTPSKSYMFKQATISKKVLWLHVMLRISVVFPNIWAKLPSFMVPSFPPDIFSSSSFVISSPIPIVTR